MAEISLIDYLYEIEAMLDDGLADDVISHCHYLLQFYPKYVNLYRLLGKGYLATNHLSKACQLFQRLLSAIPDDFEAHQLLSDIHLQNSQLINAIFHAEHAFEIQPSHENMREQLSQMLYQRDGIPPKIRLTRPALARLYTINGQYEQAIHELNTLIQEENRLDMLLLLCQTYYQTEQFDKAYSICTSLLEKLPHALEANYIAADILSKNNKIDEAQVFWQRLKELDPYDKRIPKTPEQLIHDENIVELLENAKGFVLTDDESWLNQLGIFPSEHLLMIPTYMQKQEEKYNLNKLHATADAALPQQEPVEKQQNLPSPSSKELPSWLYTLANKDFLDTKQVSDKEMNTTEDDEGDWITSIEKLMPVLQPDEEIEELHIEQPNKSKQESPPHEKFAERQPEELPDWLQELESAPTPSAERQPEELPEWLHELESAPSPSAERQPEELPDWLQELESAPSPSAERQPEELPDWLQELESAPTPSAERQPEELPDWLQELGTEPNSIDEQTMWKESETTSATVEQQKPEILPQWLINLEDKIQQPDQEYESSLEQQIEEKITTETLPKWINTLEDILLTIQEDSSTSNQEEEKSKIIEESEAEIPRHLTSTAEKNLTEDEQSKAILQDTFNLADWTEQISPQEEQSQSDFTIEKKAEIPEWLEDIIEDTHEENTKAKTSEEANSSLMIESSVPLLETENEIIPKTEQAKPTTEEDILPPLELADVEKDTANFDTIEAAINWLEAQTELFDEHSEEITIEKIDLINQGEREKVSVLPKESKSAKWILEMKRQSQIEQETYDGQIKKPIRPSLPKMLNINKATIKELELLPGVTYRTAQNIINYRWTQGPIHTLEELQRILKIDTSLWNTIPTQIVFEDSSEASENQLIEEDIDVIRKIITQYKKGNKEEALKQLSQNILEKKHLPEIIDLLKELLETYSHNVQLWQILGDAYVRTEQLHEALKAYNRAEELLLENQP